MRSLTPCRYEIRDIMPPAAVRNAMELQAEAERRKRAQVPPAATGVHISHLCRGATLHCTACLATPAALLAVPEQCDCPACPAHRSWNRRASGRVRSTWRRRPRARWVGVACGGRALFVASPLSGVADKCTWAAVAAASAGTSLVLGLMLCAAHHLPLFVVPAGDSGL